MNSLKLGRHAVSACVASLLLAGCGGMQPPIAAPESGTAAPTIVNRTTPSSSYQVLYAFQGPPDDGLAPEASLVNVKGTLYGTTNAGGANDLGSIFSLTKAGTEHVLYSFRGGSDGANPGGSLTNVNGTLYGTTQLGGTSNSGTVFRFTKDGREKVLYRFSPKNGWGPRPNGNLIDVNGTLYGTTLFGGSGWCYNYHGCGTVFSITTSGKEKVVYSFRNLPDGWYPDAGLTNVSGTLYGTTERGGSGYCLEGEGFGNWGCGTVFSITTSGTEKVLYSFGANSYNDGLLPRAGLINVRGKLYGTTFGGGGGECYVGCGTVFSVTTSGIEKVLHRFIYAGDGVNPAAGLVNVGGRLYGTTEYGGGNRSKVGVLFSITRTGKEKILHSFAGGSDGAIPTASLIDVGGTLYGTTADGGNICGSTYRVGCGTIFEFTP